MDVLDAARALRTRAAMKLATSTLALALATACGAAAPAAPLASEPSTVERASDERIQAIVDETLRELAGQAHVRLASAVVLDPRTGQVLAMSAIDEGRADPELPARESMGHGSVGKVFTLAAALDAGVIAPTDTFESPATYVFAGRTIRDASHHATMTVGDVMAFSSNIGTTRIFERLGRAGYLDAMTRFHLDHRLPPEARTDDGTAAYNAYGGGLEATSLELAAAFAAVVNGGVYHRPWRTGDAPTEGERVLRSETAAAMRTLLEGAVAREDATGHRARVEGHRVGGKTGTVPHGEGLTFGAFVGTLPVDDPRYVILVGVRSQSSDYSGGTLAAPAFARIAEQLMASSADRRLPST